VIRFLTVNIGWKLLALALAVVLWSVLVGDPELTQSVSAPVEFKNLPKEFEISSEIPESVHLEIQGPSSRLRAYNLDKAAVVLDLSSVTDPGERTFPIEPANVELPSGVTLLRAIPSQLRLDFEHLTSREVPVQIRFSGPPPPGFQVLHADAFPPQIQIVGPESRVNRVEAATTDPIDLAGVVGEKLFQVNVFVADPLVRFQSSPVVTVKVAMEKIPQEVRPRGKKVVRH
jgi:YbbR domain-containing protein